MTKEWAKNLLTPRFGAVNTPAGVSRNVNYRCLPKPDTQGNQNLHLSDSLLGFLALAVSVLPRNRMAALHFSLRLGHFQPMSAATCTGCTEALTPSFGEEIRSFYLFEGMGSFSLQGFSCHRAGQPHSQNHVCSAAGKRLAVDVQSSLNF